MRRWLLALALMLAGISGPSCLAQVRLPDASDRFAWKPPNRHVAGVLSNVTLGGQFAIETTKSLRGGHRKRDFSRQGCSIGIAQGLTLTSKFTFSKLRPNGADRKSMWSGHTSSAASQGLELTAGTGYFRVASGDHDWMDVTIGALVGFGSRSICHALVR